MNYLFGVRFAQFSYVWIFLPLIALMGLYLFGQRKIANAISLLAGKWQSMMVGNFSESRQIIRALLYGIALFFLGAALMRPQWNKQETLIHQEGRDLLIGLDISRSMLAQDCKPDRLTVAKKKIKQLLSSLDCERVGLLLFSGSAFVQCPLTTDYSSFHMYLDNVDVETISSGSTALDAALKKSIEIFGSQADRKNKILLLVTDGEDFSSNLLKLKKDAKDAGIHIFTLGVGTPEGAPIPLYDEQGNQVGHQKDSRGSVVISHLNNGILQNLSTEVGGVYVPISQDRADLTTILDHISRIEKEQFADTQLHKYEDRYNWFLLVSFVALLAEWIV